jgi:hypothetical protein
MAAHDWICSWQMCDDLPSCYEIYYSTKKLGGKKEHSVAKVDTPPSQAESFVYLFGATFIKIICVGQTQGHSERRQQNSVFQHICY